jgi:hypothetical protein
VIPRTRRAWADGDTEVSREQEQDARAVEESAPDPGAMDAAFGPVTERLDNETICRMAREYYLEFGWPGQEGTP